MRTFEPGTLARAVTMLALISMANAQRSKAPLPVTAPVPPQIAAAQKVFISNSGEGLKIAGLKGGPDRPYNQFYGEMKGWGRYDMVSSPADADLVFEISLRQGLISFAW